MAPPAGPSRRTLSRLQLLALSLAVVPHDARAQLGQLAFYVLIATVDHVDIADLGEDVSEKRKIA